MEVERQKPLSSSGTPQDGSVSPQHRGLALGTQPDDDDASGPGGESPEEQTDPGEHY